jgi:hypothetical protein
VNRLLGSIFNFFVFCFLEDRVKDSGFCLLGNLILRRENW